MDPITDHGKKESHHVKVTDNCSPTWLPGYQKTSYLSTYPWLDAYRSSVPTSTAGSAKSSRSRKSHKVSLKVKWCQMILLGLLISAGCFLIFYPLITHYIVEGAHANESHSFFPYAKENCTRHSVKT
ncbi:unnamed protein product [Allacma fusca]|uniref:Uncharacterized protein n=1 Tax=Allacma fusca TaxID=39272 RepID=A0A8J2NIG9_9HEXA|nr:unnamed protein product [Allacma fusca]